MTPPGLLASLARPMQPFPWQRGSGLTPCPYFTERSLIGWPEAAPRQLLVFFLILCCLPSNTWTSVGTKHRRCSSERTPELRPQLSAPTPGRSPPRPFLGKTWNRLCGDHRTLASGEARGAFAFCTVSATCSDPLARARAPASVSLGVSLEDMPLVLSVISQERGGTGTQEQKPHASMARTRGVWLQGGLRRGPGSQQRVRCSLSHGRITQASISPAPEHRKQPAFSSRRLLGRKASHASGSGARWRRAETLSPAGTRVQALTGIPRSEERMVAFSRSTYVTLFCPTEGIRCRLSFPVPISEIHKKLLP